MRNMHNVPSILPCQVGYPVKREGSGSSVLPEGLGNTINKPIRRTRAKAIEIKPLKVILLNIGKC